MRQYRGWTLIEVLVVVAILAVLAAIVYVLMAPAREKGRQTVCISNLRQIGQAVAMYRGDYEDGRGTGPTSTGQVPSRPNVWARLGVPPDPLDMISAGYVTDNRIFWCPLDPQLKLLKSIPPGKSPRDVKIFSYSWCPLGCFMEDRYPERRGRGVPCEVYSRLYREKGERIMLAGDIFHWLHYHKPTVVRGPDGPPAEHTRKMIGLFLRLDGSVERLNFSNMPPRSEGGSCGM